MLRIKLSILFSLLFLNLSVYGAMKADVVNNVNGLRFSGTFETQELLEDWKKSNLSNDSWGKKQRWVRLLDQKNCLQQRDIIPQDGDTYTECELPKDYTIVETDITVQEDAKKLEKSNRKTEIIALKKMLSNINSSDLPNWHKRLLRMLIKEFRE